MEKLAKRLFNSPVGNNSNMHDIDDLSLLEPLKRKSGGSNSGRKHRSLVPKVINMVVLRFKIYLFVLLMIFFIIVGGSSTCSTN